MKPTTLPLIAIVTVIIYAIFNAYRADKQTTFAQATSSEPSYERKTVTTSVYDYIVDVIVHGSNRLHFNTQEVMEGGFVANEDAPKVACFVLSLAKEACPHPYSEDAAMFYSSNCAGCHGEDGKGLNGTYPDLTKRPLLGMSRSLSH